MRSDRIPSIRGFTLIEVLVILAIISVISSIVLALLWPALADARLRTGTRMAIAALHSARSAAITQHTQVTAYFDNVNHGVSLLIYQPQDDGTHTWQALTTTVGQFQALPEGVTISDITRPAEMGGTATSASDSSTDASGAQAEDKARSIRFQPNGQAEDAMITLADRDGDARILLVDGITGQVEIADEKKAQ